MRTAQFWETMRQQGLRVADIREAPGGLEEWIGKIVKKGFDQTADPLLGREYMWLKVTGIRDGRLVGTLGNTPVYATHLSHGDEVVFEVDEIVAVE